MTSSDHLEAAKAAASALAHGQLSPAIKPPVVRHWAAHVLAYLKGSRNGR